MGHKGNLAPKEEAISNLKNKLQTKSQPAFSRTYAEDGHDIGIRRSKVYLN